MKKYLFSVALIAIAVLFSSCESLEGSESKRLKAWQSQVSHYMGKSVYQVGDKVVMITEKGVEEDFEVTKVDEAVSFIAKKMRWEWEDERKYMEYEIVDVMLQLESEENEVLFSATAYALKHTWTGIAWNEEVYVQKDLKVINNMDVTQPTITVMGKNGMKAVFVRDEGLRQLTDTLGHTWTRK